MNPPCARDRRHWSRSTLRCGSSKLASAANISVFNPLVNVVSAIAVAEFRSAWRSTRGRSFGCAVIAFTVWLFGGYMVWHADNTVPYLASAYSLPRFLIAQFGAPVLWLSLLGLLFVLFDADHRDERAGVADVLDSRPVSNTARLCGRLAAGVVVVWLPAAAALGMVQAFGALARAGRWWMGDVIEPVSLVSFLFVDLLPTLAVWGAVVLALASCLRSRVAVLLGAGALLASLAWLAANIPVYLHEALLPFAAPVGFASDLAPRFADGFALAQRAAILAAAFGLMALMPGAHWLPTPGTNIAGERRDFFALDVKVAVPPGWLVAGPGLRRPAADGFVFRPAAPVRDVALFAAPFAQRELTVDGVRVEVLAAPVHMDNLRRLVGDGKELARQVRELFAAARQMGLPYPYDGLSLVEVPARLRVYRGGAQLRSALLLPGVLAVREPIAAVRFEKRLAMFASGPAEGRMQLLKEFLRTDHHGGDLYRAFAFNLFGAVAGARGPAAPALNALCRDLTYLLVVVPPRYAYHQLPAEALAHSFHAEVPPAALVVNLVNSAVGGIWASSGPQSRRPDRPDVWEHMHGGSAAEASSDPRTAERAAYATALRASRTANAVAEVLGRERTAALLARLRRRFAGGAFAAADLVAAADDRAVLTAVEHWLTRNTLPGFAASQAVVTPAADGSGHHVRLHLRNETSAPGLAFVSTHQFPWMADSVRTRPLLIAPDSAVEVGMATPGAPAQLWLHTYLSLQRQPSLVPTVTAPTGTSSAEAFVGARPSVWRPPPARGIVVDDLSAGFSVQGASPRQRLFHRFGPPPLLDAGLAALPAGPGRWQRISAPTAVGRYRRTVARALPANGGQKALFRADLPVAGRWRLDYHLPPRRVDRPDARGNLRLLGDFALRLRAGTVDKTIAFDGRAATGGWNQLGEYDLPAGPATLEVGTRTNGRVVVADAIRWRRVNPPESGGVSAPTLSPHRNVRTTPRQLFGKQPPGQAEAAIDEARVHLHQVRSGGAHGAHVGGGGHAANADQDWAVADETSQARHGVQRERPQRRAGEAAGLRRVFAAQRAWARQRGVDGHQAVGAAFQRRGGRRLQVIARQIRRNLHQQRLGLAGGRGQAFARGRQRRRQGARSGGRLQIREARRIGRRNVDGDEVRQAVERLETGQVVAFRLGKRRVAVLADVHAHRHSRARRLFVPIASQARRHRGCAGAVEAHAVDQRLVGGEAVQARLRIAALRARRDRAHLHEAETEFRQPADGHGVLVQTRGDAQPVREPHAAEQRRRRDARRAGNQPRAPERRQRQGVRRLRRQSEQEGTQQAVGVHHLAFVLRGHSAAASASAGSKPSASGSANVGASSVAGSPETRELRRTRGKLVS